MRCGRLGAAPPAAAAAGVPWRRRLPGAGRCARPDRPAARRTAGGRGDRHSSASRSLRSCSGGASHDHRRHRDLTVRYPGQPRAGAVGGRLPSGRRGAGGRGGPERRAARPRCFAALLGLAPLDRRDRSPCCRPRPSAPGAGRTLRARWASWPSGRRRLFPLRVERDRHARRAMPISARWPPAARAIATRCTSALDRCDADAASAPPHRYPLRGGVAAGAGRAGPGAAAAGRCCWTSRRRRSTSAHEMEVFELVSRLSGRGTRCAGHHPSPEPGRPVRRPHAARSRRARWSPKAGRRRCSRKMSSPGCSGGRSR